MTDNGILYMEDSEDMKNGLDNYFKSKGYNVKFVMDYGEFEKVFPEYKPKIVIIDHDIKGNTYYYEVFQKVHRFRVENNDEIVLVGCTALPDFKNLHKEYKQQGYDEFFENDGSPEHLEKIIRFIEKKLT